MKCLKSDKGSAKIAGNLLKEGKLLILPTDTVYGFSGIIGETEDLIRKIKGRKEDKPFIVLLSEPSKLKELSDDTIPESLLKFWPGPLTVIVRSKIAPLSTVAVRCPGDPWLRDVIAFAGKPIYSTSVNRSGMPLLATQKEILDEFEDEVSLVVLDGDLKNPVPSTIVSLCEGGFNVIRKGALEL